MADTSRTFAEALGAWDREAIRPRIEAWERERAETVLRFPLEGWPTMPLLLRERAWWLPAWLDRLLPNMDVEGSNLEHRVATREAALAEDFAT